MRKATLFALTLVIALSPILTTTAHAEDTTGIFAVKCDPSLPPNATGSCGFDELFGLSRSIIRWLIGIALTLISLFVLIGGYNILTAAGNAAQVSKGIAIIRGAIIGLVIVFLSYLIVYTVFRVLGINPGNYFQSGDINSPLPTASTNTMPINPVDSPVGESNWPRY